jgi:hypothetical protein
MRIHIRDVSNAPPPPAPHTHTESRSHVSTEPPPRDTTPPSQTGSFCGSTTGLLQLPSAYHLEGRVKPQPLSYLTMKRRSNHHAPAAFTRQGRIYIESETV